MCKKAAELAIPLAQQATLKKLSAVLAHLNALRWNVAAGSQHFRAIFKALHNNPLGLEYREHIDQHF
jgi:hypothetical protein